MRKRSHLRSANEVDLSASLFSPPDLPDPWDSSVIFGDVAPLELEIGSGRGLFLKNAANSCPEHHFLGIEISKKFSRLAAMQLALDGIANAAVICGDAVQILGNNIPDDFLEVVHIYFPDPWWKNRHSRRRVVCEPVIQVVHRKLKMGGKLHFWTDVEQYFRKGLEAIARVSGWTGPLEVPEKEPEHDFDYRTHFERRTRLNGSPVFRSLFIKTVT